MTPQERYNKKNPEKVRATQRKSAKKRYEVRRDLCNLIKNKPCMDCGGTFDPVCMQFDHVRGVKQFTISNNLMSVSLPVLMTEIAKCDVVCSNCHALRTHARRK